MKIFINTSAVLVILLAGPVMTYPAASASAPTLLRARPNHEANLANAKALAPLSATPSAAAPYSAHQTDGLSRNPTIAPNTAASTRVATRSGAS